MSLPPSFFDHFEDRLNLAVFDINMGIAEIKERLKSSLPLSMTYKDGGKTEVFHYGDRDVELPAMSSDEQIAAALVADIKKLAPKESTMLKTQGLAQKIGLLKSTLNDGADKLGTRVDALTPRALQALQNGHKLLDAANSHVGEIEGVVADLEAITNGGPA